MGVDHTKKTPPREVPDAAAPPVGDLFYTSGSAAALVEALPALEVPAASAAVRGARVVVVGGSIAGLAAAACLRAAGVADVRVFERNATSTAGAGISLDDASVGVLKGLGVADGLELQRMRFIDERAADGAPLTRQPFPYFGVRYDALLAALERAAGACVTRGVRVASVDAGAVTLDSGERVACDVALLRRRNLSLRR